MKIYEELSEELLEKYLDDIKESFVHDKLIVFNNVSVSDEQVKEMMKFICDKPEDDRSEILWNQEHEGLERLDSTITEDEQIKFVFENWHIDTSPPEVPHCEIPIAIAMRMTKFLCGEDYSGTYFVDSSKLLESFPSYLIDWMKKTFIINKMGYYDKINNITYDGFALPLRVYPLVVTHEITGKNQLFYPSCHFSLLPENHYMEERFRSHLKSLLLDKENLTRVSWKEGMMILWDNRALLHSFETGWQDGERMFTRYQCGFTKPFYVIEK